MFFPDSNYKTRTVSQWGIIIKASILDKGTNDGQALPSKSMTSLWGHFQRRGAYIQLS